jgi:hypothetical protein
MHMVAHQAQAIQLEFKLLLRFGNDLQKAFAQLALGQVKFFVVTPHRDVNVRVQRQLMTLLIYQALDSVRCNTFVMHI